METYKAKQRDNTKPKTNKYVHNTDTDAPKKSSTFFCAFLSASFYVDEGNWMREKAHKLDYICKCFEFSRKHFNVYLQTFVFLGSTMRSRETKSTSLNCKSINVCFFRWIFLCHLLDLFVLCVHEIKINVFFVCEMPK